MGRVRISLAAARVNAGLSQKEAAQRMNISVKTIQNHETGKTKPDWPLVDRYVEIYGIPIDNIIW